MDRDTAEQVEPSLAQPCLGGVRVLVTRRPDRSAALMKTFREAGAEVSFLPLIDFETAADPEALAGAVRELAAGRYGWLVITSATTVDALAQAAARTGTTLAAAVPERTQVAAVGSKTAAALKRAGVDPALVPDQQSAAGLLAGWPGLASGEAEAEEILLPQADIAADTLREGLQAKGLVVNCVVAYRTVKFPADPQHALYPAGFAHENVLSAEAAQAELAAGRIHAVVVASPSQVRRLVELQVPLGGCSLVAIGPATQAQAREEGLPVTAAADPHPHSVAAAVERLVHGAGNGDE